LKKKAMVVRYEFDGRAPIISSSAYVSDLTIVIGDFVIDENSYIGHGAILRGDYGKQLYIDLATKYLRGQDFTAFQRIIIRLQGPIHKQK
jgi:hypothetical protein